MFDTRDQILDQLRADADGRAEFKEVRFGDRGVLSPNTEDLAGELAAFANAEGGVVFLGVDDSGAVTGIPLAKMNVVEHWLLNAATHHCDLPIRPLVRKAVLPGDGAKDERIVLVKVARGPLCSPNFGWPLLHAGRVHETGSGALGTGPVLPAARPGVRIRRTARAFRDRGRS